MKLIWVGFFNYENCFGNLFVWFFQSAAHQARQMTLLKHGQVNNIVWKDSILARGWAMPYLTIPKIDACVCLCVSKCVGNLNNNKRENTSQSWAVAYKFQSIGNDIINILMYCIKYLQQWDMLFIASSGFTHGLWFHWGLHDGFILYNGDINEVITSTSNKLSDSLD